jgi:hypothetical protein
MLGLAQPAAAQLQWDPANTGPTTGASGGDGTWSAAATATWFDPGTTTAEAGLLFNNGNGTVTLQSAGTTPRLLTLDGDVVTGTSTSGNVVTIGNGAANPLTLDRIAANRGCTDWSTGTSATPRSGDVYYRPYPDRVEVIAVFHTSRNPSIWQGWA